MNPLQPRLLKKVIIIAALSLAATALAARTFQRLFEAPPDKVYAAALRAAQTDGRITILNEDANQRRLHLRVNVDSIAMSQPPLGEPPSGPPITADASVAPQLGGIFLTVIVTPASAMQSSVSIEAQSPGPGIASGRYPSRFPGDRRRADEFQEKRAACTMLTRMRSILKLPNRKLAGVVSLDGCE